MNRFTTLFNKLQSDTMTLSKTYFSKDGDIAFSIDTLFGVYTKNAAKLLATVGQDDEEFIRAAVRWPFAGTQVGNTILILGGLFALLGTTDKAAELVREIPFAQPTPKIGRAHV